MMSRLLTLVLLLTALPAYAGPADPPPLPVLPEPGQVVGISRFSVADIQKLPNPGNPPTGLIRLYADSTTGNLTCLTSTGGNCLTGGGGGTCPSGSANDIQVSNGTNCIGDTNFTWNPATQSFSVTSPLGGTINLSTGGGGGVNENIILSPSAINIGANDAGVPIIFSTFHGPQMQISSANGNIEFGGGGFDAPIKLDGSTSGSSIIGVPAVAGTPNRINLPTTTGSSGNCLKTDGASPQQTSWGTCSTTTGTVTSVATTGPITGGTITATGTIACATCVTSAAALTNHALVIGSAGTQASKTIAAGASGQVVVSQGASADPTTIDYPDVKFIPAANCNNATAGNGWSIGSGGTVTCRAGTNNLGGFVSITDTSSTFATFQVEIPEDWDSSSNPFIRFQLASTDATNNHTIIPSIQVARYKGDGSTTDDVAANAAHSLSTTTLNGNANRFWSGSTIQMNSTDVTGCVAGALMQVTVGRATDTATNASFYGATITFPRLIVVQAN